MPRRRLAGLAALGAFALSTLAGAPARAEMIAGWDFSQYFGAGFLSIDGATFTEVLSANYSDLDPTFNAGAEAAAFGTMYIDGSFGSTAVVAGTGTEEIFPVEGSLASNLDAPAVNPFDSFTILADEGQTFTNTLSLRGNAAASVVFEADLTSVAGTRSDWSVTFGGKTLSGTSDVAIDFSTNGSSYQSFGSVQLTTSDTLFDVALGTASSSMAYVRLTFAPANALDLPIIDNVAIEAPEAGTGSMAAAALLALAALRTRRARERVSA